LQESHFHAMTLQESGFPDPSGTRPGPRLAITLARRPVQG
jgi:hypothetical protein